MKKLFKGVRYVLKNISEYKIGLRTIKTTLAVLLCLVAQLIFSMDQKDTFYAAIAAIVCMKETPEKSFNIGVHRFFGTFIGGIVGFVLINLKVFIPYYVEGVYILIIPLVMMVCILTCTWLKKKDGVVICCVVFLSIALDMTLNINNTILYITLRVLYTTLGIIIATLLNRYFFPYELEDKE